MIDIEPLAKTTYRDRCLILEAEIIMLSRKAQEREELIRTLHAQNKALLLALAGVEYDARTATGA